MTRPYVPDPPALARRSEGSHHAATTHAAFLRPYLLTAGRVRPVDESLELEAQVMTTVQGRRARDTLIFEHRDIIVLCATPVSVAETAAKLGLHLGVVRVLVADLLAQGHLVVLRPELGMSRDIETIERVLRGLHAMS